MPKIKVNSWRSASSTSTGAGVLGAPQESQDSHALDCHPPGSDQPLHLMPNQSRIPRFWVMSSLAYYPVVVHAATEELLWRNTVNSIQTQRYFDYTRGSKEHQTKAKKHLGVEHESTPSLLKDTTSS